MTDVSLKPHYILCNSKISYLRINKFETIEDKLYSYKTDNLSFIRLINYNMTNFRNLYSDFIFSNRVKRKENPVELTSNLEGFYYL